MKIPEWFMFHSGRLNFFPHLGAVLMNLKNISNDFLKERGEPCINCLYHSKYRIF